jgi:hypothetical protein
LREFWKEESSFLKKKKQKDFLNESGVIATANLE